MVLSHHSRSARKHGLWIWRRRLYWNRRRGASSRCRPPPRRRTQSWVCGLFDSHQNGFFNPENGLLLSMEVGLIMVSASLKPFGERLVNNLGELKKEEPDFLFFFRGITTQKYKGTNPKSKHAEAKNRGNHHTNSTLPLSTHAPIGRTTPSNSNTTIQKGVCFYL